MSVPIPIAYVINSMIVGGSQTHLLQVMRFLDRDKFAPTFYCLGGDGPLIENVKAAGVEVLSPGAGKGYRGLGLVGRVREVAASFRERRPQIVHNYLLRANLVGSVAARLAGVPIVLVSKRGCHEMRGYELLTAKIGNALSDCVTANANAVRDFVHEDEGCPLDKMRMIPSSIDVERFAPLGSGDYKSRLGLPADSFVVGAVTRMRVRKGVEEFIRSIAEVRNRNPAVHGLIVGEVEFDEYMGRIVDELGVRDHLTLLGRRSDMPEVLSAFDVFVLSSHDEGMSNAILEAMAMERPIVATDVGGTGEVVLDGESGFLVPPKEVAPLAAAIARVADNGERAAEMGRAGRRIVVEKFSAPAMVRQMEGLYLELARGKGLGL